MDRISTKISRKELFEQVWNVPMWTLAKKFGLSDVGLAKICKRNDIPRPPRGYWEKKKHGRKVQPAPLPKREDARPIIIYGHLDSDPGVTSKKISLKKIYPKEFLNREIVVPETLKDPHLLNTQAIGILQEPIIDRNGIIMTPQGPCS